MRSFTIDNLRAKAKSGLLGRDGNEQVLFVITDTGMADVNFLMLRDK
jgi:hypothetical protein